MTEFEKATPRPWFTFGNPVHCIGGPFVPEVGENPTQTKAGIAMFGMRLRHNDEAEANARLTLRAVNSFDAMVTALRTVKSFCAAICMNTYVNGDAISPEFNAMADQVIAALKLAEGDA